MNGIGGLNVTGDMGMGQSRQEEIHSAWATFDEMELQITRAGIPPLEKPACTIPHITARLLNDADTREFTQIFSNFGEWYGYITNLHGRIKAKLVEIDNEMDDIVVHNRKAMLEAWRAAGGKKSDKPTIQEMSDYNELYDHYRTLKHERQQGEQQRLMLDPRKEQLYRDMKIVSRQVEIRGQEIERNRMTGNMPGRHYRSS